MNLHHKWLSNIASNHGVLRRLLALLILLPSLVVMTVSADINPAPIQYSNEQKRDLGFEIARELRCPMAVNQNLYDSKSKIASELKGQIFLMLDEGQSKAAIIDFMVERYGEKIRYLPSFNSNTLVLWLLPLILVLLAVAGLIFFIRPTLKAQQSNQDITHD
ncbi:cytochrome c-type biogenesis protein [Shewanella youngdeokensis]|uniref:Cytochrome c-type biogenesis protein n=1 Tax=Shewanella youngdeokensis TaxID=2999068 RepID=A0ABZ0JYX8_9GAMM|nr:cytochrome c-type biogenesis protein CcmH [Shewanella sp. DAU334]